ncbi:MAG: hypothetical protein H0V76_08845 [Blastocatellia bacterium]|nr:hypothetical protein [Blastocatellia bacterium]
MKNKLFFSAALSVIIGVTGLVQVADGQNRSILNEAQRVSGDRFTVTTRTPQGVRIHAVRRPSAAMLSAIDRGLTDLFAVARKNRYTRGLNHSDYTIYIANADRTRDAAGNYSPDIAIGSAQYAGSVYDQGGYIYAAGMIISNQPMAFLIAEHTGDVSRVADLVRFEGEHLVLYHNDRRRYHQTADHSQGGSHPILQ